MLEKSFFSPFFLSIFCWPRFVSRIVIKFVCFIIFHVHCVNISVDCRCCCCYNYNAHMNGYKNNNANENGWLTEIFFFCFLLNTRPPTLVVTAQSTIPFFFLQILNMHRRNDNTKRSICNAWNRKLNVCRTNDTNHKTSAKIRFWRLQMHIEK